MNKAEIVGALTDKAQELDQIGRTAMAAFLSKVAGEIEVHLIDGEEAE